MATACASRSGGASVVAPVWIMPGQAPHCITALLGSGRRAAGSIGNHVGIDFYPLTGIDGPRDAP